MQHLLINQGVLLQKPKEQIQVNLQSINNESMLAALFTKPTAEAFPVSTGTIPGLWKKPLSCE